MKKFKSFVAIGLIIALLTGCQPVSTGWAATDLSSLSEIKIGGLFNLTGVEASQDNAARRAFDLAIKEINAMGGVNGKPLRVIVEDCKSEQTAVTNAAEKLSSLDNVAILAGLSDSTFVLAAGAIAQKNNIPFIECGGTMPDLPDQVGDVLYMACFGDNVQAYAGADFAHNILGAKTAWLFFDSGADYTLTLAKFYRERFTKLAGAGAILIEDTYQTADVDFRAQISRLRALPVMPDVLFVASGPNDSGTIVKQLRDMGVDKPIMSGDGFDTPLVVEQAEEKATDVYFTTHVAAESDNPLVRKFIDAYKAEYGVEPETTAFAALAYDTAYLIADVFKRADSIDPEAIKKALNETKDLPGVTGSLSFSTESRIPNKSVTIMQIQKGVLSFVQEIKP